MAPNEKVTCVGLKACDPQLSGGGEPAKSEKVTNSSFFYFILVFLTFSLQSGGRVTNGNSLMCSDICFSCVCLVQLRSGNVQYYN